jgi:hypothetical protein
VILRAVRKRLALWLAGLRYWDASEFTKAKRRIGAKYRKRRGWRPPKPPPPKPDAYETPKGLSDD